MFSTSFYSMFYETYHLQIPSQNIVGPETKINNSSVSEHTNERY